MTRVTRSVADWMTASVISYKRLRRDKAAADVTVATLMPRVTHPNRPVAEGLCVRNTYSTALLRAHRDRCLTHTSTYSRLHPRGTQSAHGVSAPPCPPQHTAHTILNTSRTRSSRTHTTHPKNERVFRRAVRGGAKPASPARFRRWARLKHETTSRHSSHSLPAVRRTAGADVPCWGSSTLRLKRLP